MKKKLTVMLLALGLFCAGHAEEKTIDCGSTVTITATAKEGYHFVKWSDENTDNPRTFSNVQEALTLTAYFTKEYVLTFSASEGGSVDKTTATLDEGNEITVTATATDDCYVFEKWSDGNTSNPRVFKANSSLTQTSYQAISKLKTFNFNITPQDAAMGTVTITVAQAQ
jgi:uncharacterized repeat protein (TIGR02543 family)